MTEVRRNDAWASVFLTLKDPASGATLPATVPRRTFDRLEPLLEEGETVHARGRAELYEPKGELSFRIATVERLGLGDHLVALERLKRRLAAEGLFAHERKRRLPRFPRAVGVLTGADAAARGDVLATISRRFPATKVVVRETRVQGRGAPEAIVTGLHALTSHPEVDVVVVTRGGGSFEDLLPWSDEGVVRALAAVGVAARTSATLVVPDREELLVAVEGSRRRIELAVHRRLERAGERLARARARLRESPQLLLERRRAALDRTGARLQALSPNATLARGYAIVRAGGTALRDASATATGKLLEIDLATGALAARVEEVRE